MKNKKTSWILIILVLLLIAFLFNLCGFGDMVANWAGIDQDRDSDDQDDTDDTGDTDDTDDQDEDEPPPYNPADCIAPYIVVDFGDVIFYKATNQDERTWILYWIPPDNVWEAEWAYGGVPDGIPGVGSTGSLYYHTHDAFLNGRMSGDQDYWYWCMLNYKLEA